MSMFRTRKFKRLQKKWYSKLEDLGFDEIEDTDSPREFLKSWHNHHFQNIDPLVIEFNKEYYDQARSALHTYRFETKKEEKIWELHADGLSLREIAAKLKIKIHIAHTTVNHLKERMSLSTELINVRNYEVTDISLIYATWLNGLYHGNSWFGEIPEKTFHTKYHQTLERLFSRPTVEITIACLKEDRDTIVAYCVHEKQSVGRVLHWIFTKPIWRKFGVTKLILPDNIVATTHLTAVGRSIKPKKWKFDPFLL